MATFDSAQVLLEDTASQTNPYQFFGDEDVRAGAPDNRAQLGSAARPLDITSPVPGEPLDDYLVQMRRDGTITIVNGAHPGYRLSHAGTGNVPVKQICEFGALYSLAGEVVVTYKSEPTIRTKNLGKIEVEHVLHATIWNADSISRQIVSKDVSGQVSGVSDSISSLPLTIPPFGKSEQTITVAAAGDRTVSAMISLTQDEGGGQQSLTVQGVRVVDFWYPPDWESGIEPTASFLFRTMLYRSDSLKEQRATAFQEADCIWELTATFKTSAAEGKAIWNLLNDIRGEKTRFPFFVEPFFATTNVVGQTILTVASRPLSTFLMGSSRIIRIDLRDPFYFEERDLIPNGINTTNNTISTNPTPGDGGGPWSASIPPAFAQFNFLIIGYLAAPPQRHPLNDQVDLIDTVWRSI